jgi:tetratricopeptide (TPR) repeat protein
MDFQFVEKSTRRILEEIMKQAPDYSTYVKILSTRVLTEDNPADEITLIALRHSEYLGGRQTYLDILEKHRNKDVLIPYYLTGTVADKDDWTHRLFEIERLSAQCNSDWIRYWYLIHLYWLGHTRAIDEYLAERTETHIEQLVTKNRALDCYTPQFYYLKSQRMRYEGDIDRAIELSLIMLQKARGFEDKYFEARALKELGALNGFYSFKPELLDKAKPFLHEARQICEVLGDTRGLIEILSYVGGICGKRGEFTEYKKINLEVLNLREVLGDEPKNELHNAAAISILLGEGKEALEWAKVSLEPGATRPLLLPYLHLNKAAALILLNRLDEAQIEIDVARRLNIETGLEPGLAYEYMVNGLLEKARGDYESALHSFETAMEIDERNSRFNRMIVDLMRLAETEVEAFDPTPENRDDELSGQWLERFDQFSKENNLPGFIGNALCLKSELRFKQGRHAEANQILSEVLKMAEHPGLAHLRDEAILLQDVRILRDRSK